MKEDKIEWEERFDKEFNLYKQTTIKSYPTSNGGLSNLQWTTCGEEVKVFIKKEKELSYKQGKEDALDMVIGEEREVGKACKSYKPGLS